MSESESEGVGWNDDLSSESKEDIELRLDIEERSESWESLSLVEGMRGSMDMSCKYLERQARLKERSTSSSSLSSLQQRGRSGMITHKKKTQQMTTTMNTQVGWRPKNLEMPTPCRQVTETKGTHYFAHYWHFHARGVSKLTINCPLIISLFCPLIKKWPWKRLNGKINGTNNGLNNGNFERPYWGNGWEAIGSFKVPIVVYINCFIIYFIICRWCCSGDW